MKNKELEEEVHLLSIKKESKTIRNKNIVVTQPTFFPYSGFFAQFFFIDEIIFLDDVQFDKNSWQKRNKIKTKDKFIYLRIDTQTKGKYLQKINEVKIDYNEKKKKKLINTIYFNYKKSKYFEEYFGSIEEILNKNYEKLIDINLEIIYLVNKIIGVQDKKILFSSQLGTKEKKFKLIEEIYLKTKATSLLSTSGVMQYFPKNLPYNMNVKFFEYNDNVHPYEQLFGKFIPRLSIIDLLFNCGPESITNMKKNFKIIDNGKKI